MYINEEEAS